MPILNSASQRCFPAPVNVRTLIGERIGGSGPGVAGRLIAVSLTAERRYEGTDVWSCRKGRAMCVCEGIQGSGIYTSM